MDTDVRRSSPSALRNRDPIRAVLQGVLPPHGLVLEIASGSGEHVSHFASIASPALVFQPSDPDLEACASVDAWVAALGLANIRPALPFDVTVDPWPVAQADGVICCNMIHIAPWAATFGLVQGAARILPIGGFLFLYGPFRRGGQHTSPSNAAFDQDLRARNPAWGVRDLEAVVALARTAGFSEPMIEAMPANNLALIFHRVSA